MKEADGFLAQYQRDMGIEFDRLLSKTARINNHFGCKPADILGWDYLVRSAHVCYYFYAAQPPLVGMTHSSMVICPLGLKAFDSYKVGFQQAVEILNTVDCGNCFVEMSLYQPLTPQVKEPEWHIRTSLGCEVVIGADSGNVLTDDSGKNKNAPQ